MSVDSDELSAILSMLDYGFVIDMHAPHHNMQVTASELIAVTTQEVHL